MLALENLLAAGDRWPIDCFARWSSDGGGGSVLR